MIIEINFLCKVRIIADVVGRLKLHLRETERVREIQHKKQGELK